MPEHGPRRSPARMLAPIALVLALFACLVVVSKSTNSNGDTSKQETSSRRADQRQRTGVPRRPARTVYTVKLNDTLGLIAQKTGLTVERIQALNPALDPQSLVVGQKIKLRE